MLLHRFGAISQHEWNRLLRATRCRTLQQNETQTHFIIVVDCGGTLLCCCIDLERSHLDNSGVTKCAGYPSWSLPLGSIANLVQPVRNILLRPRRVCELWRSVQLGAIVSGEVWTYIARCTYFVRSVHKQFRCCLRWGVRAFRVQLRVTSSHLDGAIAITHLTEGCRIPQLLWGDRRAT